MSSAGGLYCHSLAWMIIPICLLDIDECSEESTNECDVYEDCTNTQGSYNCTCKNGFHRGGKTCTGI